MHFIKSRPLHSPNYKSFPWTTSQIHIVAMLTFSSPGIFALAQHPVLFLCPSHTPPSMSPSASLGPHLSICFPKLSLSSSILLPPRASKQVIRNWAGRLVCPYVYKAWLPPLKGVKAKLQMRRKSQEWRWQQTLTVLWSRLSGSVAGRA
jgi:hypothetical protein